MSETQCRPLGQGGARCADLIQLHRLGGPPACISTEDDGIEQTIAGESLLAMHSYGGGEGGGIHSGMHRLCHVGSSY